ncbi:MAG: hypothetical protein ACJAWP_000026 [Porticoccus sp.]|jgi:hypothetical protein|uniref:hypothetical protein n=1 Tax=Porticoccus sp. TaxID=2024853 RepID=UPI0039E2F565|tara:strand:+ start:555 stop:707 length:153 start_codon:yes stop_codon:yes gene_type:complete
MNNEAGNTDSRLLVLLFTLDWQQRWRAENVMKEQGRFSDCRKESPASRVP